MSTKIGVAPTRAIAPAVAKNVYGVVMTSSPGPMSSAIRQASRASLPDETPTAWEHFEYVAMAFSHCSTFEPRMKCCDSNTSAIAASDLALMAAYCALRSSSGTFMPGFLSQLPVRFGACGQLCGQCRLFIQVQTSKDAGFNLLIAVPAFRTPHHAVGIGRLEPMAMPTHPADLTRRVAHDQREVRDALGDHRAGSDERIPPNRGPADDGGVRANRAPALQPDDLVERVSIHLGSRIGDIGQHAGGSEKDVVFDDHARVDGHVVLNLDVAADDGPAVDIDVLADDAALADAGALHDMREMPDLGAGADLGTLIDVRRFVHEIRQFDRLALGVEP